MRSLANASGDVERLRAFVGAELLPSAPAVGASLKGARATIGAIDNADLAIIEAARQQTGGPELLDELDALMRADELAEKLAPRLANLYQRARELVILSRGEPPAGAGPLDEIVIWEADAVDRDTAVAELGDLRTRLERGDIDGDEFTIRVTSRPQRNRE
jgi:hypothetical protein